MISLRLWIIAALLVGSAMLLHERNSFERIVASEPLSDVPNAVAGWTGTDQSIDTETRDVLGPGDFLSRLYSRPQPASPIGLFIGYFPSQRTGVTIHSPKNCLPGAGWVFESSQSLLLNDLDGRPHRVGEYVIANGEHRQFVIYWYQAHGRSVANEYMAKIYLVADAIRMNRSDGALVRVTTPIGLNESNATARDRAEQFTQELFPMLPRFIPD